MPEGEIKERPFNDRTILTGSGEQKPEGSGCTRVVWLSSQLGRDNTREEE